MPSDMATEYTLRPISRRDYHRMGEAGIIGPDERVELLDGELIAMPQIGPDHGFSVRECTELFVRRLVPRAIVSVRLPIALDEYSEPQPDIVVLAPRADRYRFATPEPSDVLFVVEVAKSSWRYDRGRKLRAYARNGIAEFWIVHLAASRIVRFRDPAGEAYRDERAFERGQSINAQAFPADAFEVAAFIP